MEEEEETSSKDDSKEDDEDELPDWMSELADIHPKVSWVQLSSQTVSRNPKTA